MSILNIRFYIVAALLVVAFILGNVVPAQAAAIFQVSSSATTITRIGHTEPIGAVTFTVASGTTSTGTVEFYLPGVTFTNTGGAGITVTGTGGLAGATILNIISDQGLVIINVPAGATTGASATLSGIRISAVGKVTNSLDAQISLNGGNSLIAGQNSVRVVSSATDGMLLTTDGTATITVVNGGLLTGPGTFTVAEGSLRSFSSAVGVAGQTVKTQIIFLVQGLPDNISVTFPSPIVDTNGATLVTLSGLPETLTNQSPTNRVIYEFNDSASSPGLIDGFIIIPAVSNPSGVAGIGTATVQVALGPFGVAVPNSDYPSTAVPRFDPVFLPPLGPTSSGPTTLFTLPVPIAADDQTVTIFNSASGGASITVRARRADGNLSTAANVTSEVTFTLLSQQTKTGTLKDLFGSGALTSDIATVEVESLNSKLVVTSIVTMGGRRFSVTQLPQVSFMYFPFDRQTSADVSILNMYNGGTSDASVTVSLISSSGATLGTGTRTVSARGAVREGLTSLFPSTTVPLEGYLIVRASAPLRTLLVNNAGSRPEIVPILISSPVSASFPFFAFGAGYSSKLIVINPSETLSAKMTLNIYFPNGTLVNTQPFITTLAPKERQTLDLGSIFGTGSGDLVAGYLSFTLQGVATSPFSNPPQVYPLMRISTDGFSTAVPFVETGGPFFITPTMETTASFTGLAVHNTNSSSVNVTVDLISATGSAIGTVSFSLAPNTTRVQLLRELIPQSLSHQNGIMRVSTASGGVRVVGFQGALNSSELIYLRGETIQ